MLTELCSLLRNYFLRDYSCPDSSFFHGSYTISGGKMQALPFLKEGQYYRIIGSVFNDGVWQYHDPERGQPDTRAENAPQMKDETFTGTIWAMCIPPAFLALAAEIEDWTAANADALNSPYQSESFGGYSYSKASGSGGAGGSGSAGWGWQDQFAARLAPYRRLSVL